MCGGGGGGNPGGEPREVIWSCAFRSVPAPGEDVRGFCGGGRAGSASSNPSFTLGISDFAFRFIYLFFYKRLQGLKNKVLETSDACFTDERRKLGKAMCQAFPGATCCPAGRAAPALPVLLRILLVVTAFVTGRCLTLREVQADFASGGGGQPEAGKTRSRSSRHEGTRPWAAPGPSVVSW